MDISRERALQLMHEYISSENLRKHCLAVEVIMQHFARKEGEDVQYWGCVGLLHDLDWEQFPDQHCHKTAEILRSHGYSEEFITSVQSHGFEICTDVVPTHRMEKILYALDELSGFIVASTLVLPSKSLMDLEVASVLRKWKKPAFAAGVNRDIVMKGLEMVDMDLSDAIQECIIAMRTIAHELGLA